MLGYVVRRILWAIPVLLLASFLAFALVKALQPPFDNNVKLAPSVKENLNQLYGLKDPYLVQYWSFLKDVAHGDLGLSTKPGYRPVKTILGEVLPASMILGSLAFLFAAVFGTAFGILAAVKANGWVDYLITFFATIAFALPSFVVATLWVAGWVPIAGTKTLELPYGWDTWVDRLGPITVLGLSIMPYFTRLVRASMLEALQQEFVTTARAKGLPYRKTIMRHAVRNSMIPTVTNAGPLFAFVLTGSFIIERIMSVPGAGDLFIRAFDPPTDSRTILATTALVSTLIIVINLIVDIIVAKLDPRIVND